MTNPNTSTSNPEIIDSPNNSKYWEDPYKRLIKSFTEDKLKNKLTRASFVSHINADGELKPGLLNQIRKFAKNNSEFSKLSIDWNTVSYESLKNQIADYTVTLNNNRRQIKDIFLKEYEISPSEYEKLIGKKIDKLEEPDLTALLSRSTQRKKLLQSVYGKNKIPSTQDVMKFLDKFNLWQRYQKLEEHQQFLVKRIDDKFRKTWKLDVNDIISLLETKVFSDNEKKELLRVFVPTISLQKAIDLWIYSQKDARKYKEKLVKKAVSARSIQLPQKSDEYEKQRDLDMVVSRMVNSEIIIPTYDIFSRNQNVTKILDDIDPIKDFVSNYNSMTDEVKENIQWIKTLSDFQWELSNIPTVFWARKFQEWSVIEIKQKKNDGSEEDQVVYGKVLKANDKGEIRLLDRWSWRYTTNSESITTESYDDILKVILHWKPKLGLTTTSFTVMTESEVKHKVFSGELDRHAWDWLEQREKWEVKDRINELNEEHAQRVAKLKSEWKTRHEIADDEELKRISKEKLVQNEALDDLDEYNRRSLVRELDEIDPSWKKFGLEDGTSFKVLKWSQKDQIYTITGVNQTSWTVNITSAAWNQDMKFDDSFPVLIQDRY